MERNLIEIKTTVKTKEIATKISSLLLKEKLAACVQVFGPIQSDFIWEGEIQSEEEWFIMIKTNADLYQKIEDCIKKVHHYEVPEIYSVPISNASSDYLSWVNNTTI